MKTNFIEIKHGPQFNGLISTMGLFGGIGSLVYLIILLTSSELVTAALTLISLVICSSIFLDYRGVQIDLSNKRIREYRSLLGYKHGRWESLSDFKQIRLKWERTHTTSSYGQIIQDRSHGYSSDGYCVVLEGAHSLPFEVGEYASYKAAKSVMLQLSSSLNLPCFDNYAKILESAKESRRNIEGRATRR
ncbi:MAG: hypothetical protein R2813_06635 [Flavobacteriales bacterium]